MNLDTSIDVVNAFLEPPDQLQGLFSNLVEAAKSKSTNPQLVDQTTGIVRALFDLVAEVITP
jgi:hypothetical protein